MKSIRNVLFILLTIAIVSCSQSDLESSDNEKFEVFDATRKVFSNENDLLTFLKIAQQDSSIIVNAGIEKMSTMTILERFLKTTPYGDIVNAKNEYQVGDYIHKFGMSGYTEYKINPVNYAEALRIISKDDEIITKINNYEQTEDNVYKISEGIFVIYTGYPLSESIEVTPPEKRISSDGLTKVRVSFVTSYSYFSSSAGIRVEAWHLVNNEFVDYQTDLRAVWHMGIYEFGFTIPCADDSGIQRGNQWGRTLVSFTGIGAPRYSMVTGSMSGSCKCWDGEWITATYNK